MHGYLLPFFPQTGDHVVMRKRRLTRAGAYNEFDLCPKTPDDPVSVRGQPYGGRGRAAGDRRSATRAAIGLGFAAAYRGNHLDAVERLETALAEERPSPQMRPDVYATLGQSYAALGAADRAARLFERCLEEVREAAP